MMKIDFIGKMALGILLIFILNCSGGKDRGPLDIVLQRDLTIGGPVEDEHQVFRFIISADIDKYGNLYIIDPNLKIIRKFDKEGKFIWELNRKGQGPGEFLRPIDIDIATGGKLYIADQNNKKIIILSEDGQFINEFKTKIGSPFRIDTDSKGDIYVFFIEKTKEHLIHKFSPAGEWLTSFVQGNKDEKNPELRRAKNSLYFCIDKDDHIFVVFQYEYRVLEYDLEGTLLAEWTHDLPYKPDKLRMEQPQPNAIEIKGDSITKGISTDSRGNVYVLWGCKSTEKGSLIDVFSNDGGYLGNFYTTIKPIHEGWQFFHIDRMDNLYIIDPIEEPKITRFKMQRIMK